jgi:polyether ionophore transport system permease protein
MSSLAGTGTLVRLALRRDRVRLTVWTVALAGLTLGTASAFVKLYPTAASRQQFGVTIARSPALLALTGPAFDLSSIGGLVAWRLGGLGAVLVALMSLFAVIRHTRAEEEAGRLELVGSGMVGRRAPLTAGLIVAFGAAGIVGILVAAGLVGMGLPATGAVALGLAFASAGWMFAAIAAVAAQLTENGRTATGIAGGVLAVSYLLRAMGDSAGDSGPSWLSWLSPIGWTQQVRPFAGERWWVFGLAGALVVVLLGTAYALVARRDIGAGLLPPRLGPAEADPGLRSPLALAWRLQRGALAGWAAGFVVFGAAVGAVAQGVGDLLEGNPQLERILESVGGSKGIVDAYLASVLGLLGVVASAYAVQATLRLRSEETAQRAEPVLATRTGRIEWASSHLVLAAAGTAVILAAAGLAAGLTHGLRTGDVGTQVPRLVGAALVNLPAALVLAGIAVLLFGLFPHLTGAAWGVLAFFLVLGQLGPMLKLAQPVMDLSPFMHVPKLPGGPVTLTPLAGLAGVALVLAGAGLAGFRRRDIG